MTVMTIRRQVRSGSGPRAGNLALSTGVQPDAMRPLPVRPDARNPVPPGPPGLAGPFARVRRRRVFSLAAACALLLAWAVLAPLSFARPELPGVAAGPAVAFVSVTPDTVPVPQ